MTTLISSSSSLVIGGGSYGGQTETPRDYDVNLEMGSSGLSPGEQMGFVLSRTGSDACTKAPFRGGCIGAVTICDRGLNFDHSALHKL